MAKEVNWENPGCNPLVTANLTLQSFVGYIGPNCTDNCSIAATKFLGYLLGNHKKCEKNLDIHIYQLNNFISCCTDDEFTNCTLGQTADWFTNNMNKDFLLGNLVQHTLDLCPIEFCRALKWEGNPDVSGIGVNAAFVVQAVLESLFLLFYIGFYVSDWGMLNTSVNIAFCIQAALTTVFLLIYVGFYITETYRIRKNPAQANQKVTSLWRKAADDCLEVFWSTCYVFALTLAVGTLCFNVIYDSPGHVYSGYFTYLGTVLSVAVLICLWPWFPGRYRYPVLTFSGVSVLLGLVVGVSMTFLKEVKSDDKTTFEKTCLESNFNLKTSDIVFLTQTEASDREKSTTSIQKFVTYTPYSTLALFILWGGAFSFIHVRRNKITNWKLYKIITGILGGLLVLCSFVLVCSALVLFFSLRIEVGSLAGPSNAENKWGFGQIVAIVAWGPLVAQIGMIFFRSVLKDTKFQKWFNPAPESERYTHHLLAQSPTVGPHHGHGSDVEKEPVTHVTQQDITDAGQR